MKTWLCISKFPTKQFDPLILTTSTSPPAISPWRPNTPTTSPTKPPQISAHLWTTTPDVNARTHALLLPGLSEKEMEGAEVAVLPTYLTATMNGEEMAAGEVGGVVVQRRWGRG